MRRWWSCEFRSALCHRRQLFLHDQLDKLTFHSFSTANCFRIYSNQRLPASQFQRTDVPRFMTDSSDFKEIVKQQADIVRIVGDYVKLKKAGAQNYSGICPFHNEKTPSFSVHATRQFFHCFGCGVSGDVFSFVQKIENITFPEAVRAIAQKLGIALPKVSFSSPAEAKEAKLRTVLLEIHERACTFFQEYLKRPESANAREYLAGRGLDEGTIKTFRIGYAPDSGFLLRDRLKGEFDEEMLRESGVFSWKQENSRQPSALSPQQSARSLDSSRNNKTVAEGNPASRDLKPTANNRFQPALSERRGQRPPPCIPSFATG